MIINTDEADFEFLFLDKNLPVSKNVDEIVSVMLVPWSQNTRTQLFNITSMGKYYFKYFKYNNHSELIQSDSFIPDSDGYYDRFSCPLILNGTMAVFGGQNECNQISVVYPTGIERIGSLPFEFAAGQCTYSNGTVFLGYSLYEKSQCYST